MSSPRKTIRIGFTDNTFQPLRRGKLTIDTPERVTDLLTQFHAARNSPKVADLIQRFLASDINVDEILRSRIELGRPEDLTVVKTTYQVLAKKENPTLAELAFLGFCHFIEYLPSDYRALYTPVTRESYQPYQISAKEDKAKTKEVHQSVYATDKEKAEAFLNKALPDARAYYYLGALQADAKNDTQAEGNFTIAALQGHAGSMIALYKCLFAKARWAEDMLSALGNPFVGTSRESFREEIGADMFDEGVKHRWTSSFGNEFDKHLSKKTADLARLDANVEAVINEAYHCLSHLMSPGFDTAFALNADRTIKRFSQAIALGDTSAFFQLGGALQYSLSYGLVDPKDVSNLIEDTLHLTVLGCRYSNEPIQAKSMLMDQARIMANNPKDYYETRLTQLGTLLQSIANDDQTEQETVAEFLKAIQSYLPLLPQRIDVSQFDNDEKETPLQPTLVEQYEENDMLLQCFGENVKNEVAEKTFFYIKAFVSKVVVSEAKGDAEVLSCIKETIEQANQQMEQLNEELSRHQDSEQESDSVWDLAKAISYIKIAQTKMQAICDAMESEKDLAKEADKQPVSSTPIASGSSVVAATIGLHGSRPSTPTQQPEATLDAETQVTPR